jgi:RNA-directed DNA polymerase
MTAGVTSPAGAASREPLEWHSLPWENIQRNVRRLQARIVKATQEGRWGKVKALQRLLTRSFSGRALAVRRVTENQGKNTPGVDGEIWNTPAWKMKAVEQLRQRGYQPQPLRRVYIPKSNGKRRPLGIPTMKDRAMQALYLLALDPVAETLADPNSYGFRKGRCPADAIAQCFNVLSRRSAPEWVLEGDICSCFDRISHAWLLAHIPLERVMLHKWLKAGYMEQGTFHPTEEGTPQGGIISPVLANMALDGLEQRLRECLPRRWKGHPVKVNLVRYADDFIITAWSREFLEDQVKPVVEQFLAERGLELSAEKTVITHISEGFDFLGQNVRKYAGKLLIKPSQKSIQALREKVRYLVRTNRQSPAIRLVQQLNPVLRGWAEYHRHVVSKAVFNAADTFIFQILWQWAQRRHPNKSKGWVKKKYFCTHQGRQWVFFGKGESSKSKEGTAYLCTIGCTPIRRHVKVRGQANPYDLAWELYFEERLGDQMKQRLAGQRRVLHLWQEQGGTCPVCGQQITEETHWHAHHIIRRTEGGSDQAGNQVLLHPDCHRRVHCLGIFVGKPRLAWQGV